MILIQRLLELNEMEVCTYFGNIGRYRSSSLSSGDDKISIEPLNLGRQKTGLDLAAVT
jgi:hypothetical protein